MYAYIHKCAYVHLCIQLCMYIHIYIYRERERERGALGDPGRAGRLRVPPRQDYR